MNNFSPSTDTSVGQRDSQPKKCNSVEYMKTIKGLNPNHQLVDKADKMKTPYQEHQLSGLGFSSTMRNSVIVKVDGTFSRTLKVNF